MWGKISRWSRLNPVPDSSHEDQKRVMTAGLALKKGANYIVVGRPITGAEDPVKAVHQILKDVQT